MPLKALAGVNFFMDINVRTVLAGLKNSNLSQTSEDQNSFSYNKVFNEIYVFLMLKLRKSSL